jgi:coproporphyrinogen III oxidase-like Fe-S oxidoreductase
MGKKKKKIREKFDEVFRSGDESKIKKMLAKYPWLLDEQSGKMDKVMLEQREIIAATGVMEDELSGPVKIDDIVLCLNVDFNISKKEEDIKKILTEVENLGLVKQESSGWTLTSEGGQICDEVLNKTLKDFEL